jgi:hypothetical protein
MDLEDRFGEVDADCVNVTHWMAPLMLWPLQPPHHGTSMPGGEPSTASLADEGIVR